MYKDFMILLNIYISENISGNLIYIYKTYLLGAYYGKQ